MIDHRDLSYRLPYPGGPCLHTLGNMIICNVSGIFFYIYLKIGKGQIWFQICATINISTDVIVVFIDAQARRTQLRGTWGTGWFFRLSSKTVNSFFKRLPSTFHDLTHEAIILCITYATLYKVWKCYNKDHIWIIGIMGRWNMSIMGRWIMGIMGIWIMMNHMTWSIFFTNRGYISVWYKHLIVCPVVQRSTT